MSNHIDYEINKELGECYLFMGEYDKADGYYRKAISADPAEAEGYLGLATVAVQKGSLDEAALLYTKAAELRRFDKPIAGLALVKMEKEEHAEALGLFMQALDLNPGNMVAVNGMVQEGYRLNRLDEVIPYLRAAIGEEHAEPLRYALAGCLTSLGREDEARKELEVLLGVNPADQRARELYERVAA